MTDLVQQRSELWLTYAECRHNAIPDVNEALERELKATPSDSLMKEEVGPEEIAAIVSKWTGIPVTKLQEADKDRLLRLGQELHQRVVGQDAAVDVVADAVLRSRYMLRISCYTNSLC